MLPSLIITDQYIQYISCVRKKGDYTPFTGEEKDVVTLRVEWHKDTTEHRNLISI